MADATPLSFGKQIDFAEAEVTATTNETITEDIIEGDGTITKVVQVTAAEYAALTPVDTTLYVVVG